MQNYNEILRGLREDADLTQTELGKIFKLTQRQVSTYETGRNEPPYEILKQYAIYFGVSTDYILGLTKEPKPIWQITQKGKNNFTNNGNINGSTINMN